MKSLKSLQIPVILLVICTFQQLPVNGSGGNHQPSYINVNPNLIQQFFDSLSEIVDSLEVFNLHYNRYSEPQAERYVERVFPELVEMSAYPSTILDARNITYRLNYFFKDIVHCIKSSHCPERDRDLYIRQIMNTSSSYREALGDFNKKLISHGSINMDQYNRDFLRTVVEFYMTREQLTDFCGSAESNRMKVDHFYNKVLLMIVKNYSLLVYVANYLQNHSNSNNYDAGITASLKDSTDKLELLFQHVMQDRVTAFSELSPVIRMCDPRHHNKHETYERITHFIQAFVGNEKLFNKDRQCHHKCSLIKTQSLTRMLDSQVQLIYIGQVFNCETAPKFDFIYKQFQPPDFERFYHHFANENPVILYGRNVTSPGIQVMKYSRGYLNGFGNTTVTDQEPQCEICLCQIDRAHTSNAIRTFSRQIMTLPRDYVATGVRLAVRKQVVFLELRGTKMQEGMMDPASTKWFSANGIDSATTLHDEMYLTTEKRSICLDSVKVPWGKFVVGAAFTRINDTICLALQAKSLGDDQRFVDRDSWHEWSNDSSRYRVEINLDEPDASEYARTGGDANKDRTESPQNSFFIKFQPTDFKKDAGQTTVPYLDIREVVTNPPAPLQAIGLYYRGQPGYGGFIAPKISTIDLHAHQQQVAAISQRAVSKINALVDFYSAISKQSRS